MILTGTRPNGAYVSQSVTDEADAEKWRSLLAEKMPDDVQWSVKEEG